jgi:hypothetical protein
MLYIYTSIVEVIFRVNNFFDLQFNLVNKLEV